MCSNKKDESNGPFMFFIAGSCHVHPLYVFPLKWRGGKGLWGDSHIKQTGMLVGFWVKPVKETNLGVAQAFCDP